MDWNSFMKAMEHFVTLGTASGFVCVGYNKIKILFEPKAFDKALEKLEVAVVETHAFISASKEQCSNRNLEQLWKEAATALKEVKGLEEITGIAFEKQLYWQNPQYYKRESPKKAEEIKLLMVRDKLSELRGKIVKGVTA